MKRGLVAVFCLALAACISPDTPTHTAAYDFSDGAGDIFHWPTDRLPVRYWVDPRGNMAALVQRAIGIWQDQFMYGEFRGALVSDSSHADVIVFWSDSVPPTVSPDQGAPVKACGGVTTYDSLTNDNHFSGPLQTSITILTSGATPAQVEACVQRTVVHELGHTLGILQDENSDSTAIMYHTPLVRLPSQADMETIQVLYHTTPTVFPPNR